MSEAEDGVTRGKLEKNRESVCNTDCITDTSYTHDWIPHIPQCNSMEGKPNER